MLSVRVHNKLISEILEVLGVIKYAPVTCVWLNSRFYLQNCCIIFILEISAQFEQHL